MKNSMTLGWLALSRTVDDLNRSRESRKVTKQAASLLPLSVRSVVTASNIIPLAEDVFADGQGSSLYFTAAVQDRLDAGTFAANEDGLKFELAPVSALGVVRLQSGNLALIDLEDRGEVSLPQNSTLVGIVSVQDVAHVGVLDKTTGQRLSLGYKIADTNPENFVIPGIPYEGAGNQTDTADETVEFESWTQCALRFREREQAAQSKKQAWSEAEQAEEAELQAMRDAAAILVIPEIEETRERDYVVVEVLRRSLATQFQTLQARQFNGEFWLKLDSAGADLLEAVRLDVASMRKELDPYGRDDKRETEIRIARHFGLDPETVLINNRVPQTAKPVTAPDDDPNADEE